MDDFEDRLGKALQGQAPEPEAAPSSVQDRPQAGTTTRITPDWARPGYDPTTQRISQAVPSDEDRLGAALSGKKGIPDQEPQNSAAYNVGRRMTETSSPLVNQALAATSGFGDVAMMGWQPWAEAALVKGASYLDPRESNRAQREKIQAMPIKDITEMARGMSGEAQKQYPKTTLAGEATGLVGSAAALPVVAPEAGAALSGAATGATYGAVSGLSKDLNPMDAIKEGVIGGVAGGTLSPVIEKTIGGLSRLFSSGTNIIDHNGLLSQEAAAVAKAAGLTDSEILQLGPRLGDAFQKYGMRPEAVTAARFGEFGMTPTVGMVTKDPAALEREALYAQPSYEKIQQQASNAAETMTGSPLSTREAVDVAVQAAQEKAAASRAAADKAYSDAAEMGGFFPRSSITNVGDSIIQSMGRDSKLGNMVSDPSVQTAVKRLNDTLGAEVEVGAPLVPGGKPITTVHQDFNAVEAGRQALNQELTAAMKRGDGAAARGLHEVIDRFDNHIQEQMNNGAFSGDPAVVDKWKEARSLWSDYKTKYGVQRTGEESGNLLKQIVDQQKSPDDVGRMLFNYSSGTGDASMKVTAMKTVNQLNRALGPNSPEMQGIKSSFVNELMQPSEASPAGFAKSAARINDFLNGRGAGVSKRFLTDSERGVLSRFAKVMEQAGSVPDYQLQKQVSGIAETAKLAAPAILSGASYVIANLHPALSVALGVAGYVPTALKRYNALKFVASKAANTPFTGKGPLEPVQSIRTALPSAMSQMTNLQGVIDQANQQNQNLIDSRPQRQSGGRAVGAAKSKADKLISMVDRIKKEQSEGTKPLLNVDDTTIAKALAIANRGI